VADRRYSLARPRISNDLLAELTDLIITAAFGMSGTTGRE
jgi:hypothetical protein